MGYRKRKRSCGNQSDRKTWSSLEDVDDGMVVWVLMIRQSRVELNRKGVQGNGCTEWEQSSSSVSWCTEVAAVGCVLRGAWCTDQGMKSEKKKPGGNLEGFMWFREIAVAASGDTVEMVMKLEGLMREPFCSGRPSFAPSSNNQARSRHLPPSLATAVSGYWRCSCRLLIREEILERCRNWVISNYPRSSIIRHTSLCSQTQNLFVIGLEEDFPLFTNPVIERTLSHEARGAFLSALVSDGRAEWMEKGHRKCLILWHRIQDWADLILRFVKENGLEDSVMTVEEIRSGPESQGTELHGMDRTVLMRALKLLEHKGKLAIFKGTSADDEGVKFSV
ncbi:hypothetical protein F0562_007680 [Nyssa sinensis]|uniref:ESCRT-II complex subunit VPS25 n=1 Tax=Nyssa sinensis TaxID=561372 RepID=A0A5J5A412_9ASTE|nr:hypothetical protein F0562_007680 [Nyssa sinensis]